MVINIIYENSDYQWQRVFSTRAVVKLRFGLKSRQLLCAGEAGSWGGRRKNQEKEPREPRLRSMAEVDSPDPGGLIERSRRVSGGENGEVAVAGAKRRHSQS